MDHGIPNKGTVRHSTVLEEKMENVAISAISDSFEILNMSSSFNKNSSIKEFTHKQQWLWEFPLRPATCNKVWNVLTVLEWLSEVTDLSAMHIPAKEEFSPDNNSIHLRVISCVLKSIQTFVYKLVQFQFPISSISLVQLEILLEINPTIVHTHILLFVSFKTFQYLTEKIKFNWGIHLE